MSSIAEFESKCICEIMFNGPGFSFEKWQVIGSKGRIRLIASNQRRRLVVCASGGPCEKGCPGKDPNKQLKNFRYTKIILCIFKILLREDFINRSDYSYDPGPARYTCRYCRRAKTFAEILRVIRSPDSVIF